MASKTIDMKKLPKYKEKLKELEDVNKPEIKASQMDVIDNGLQQTFENFDLDIEQFEYEFSCCIFSCKPFTVASNSSLFVSILFNFIIYL